MRRGHASTFRNQLLITDSKDIPPRRPCDAFFRIFKSCSDQTVQDGFVPEGKRRARKVGTVYTEAAG